MPWLLARSSLLMSPFLICLFIVRFQYNSQHLSTSPPKRDNLNKVTKAWHRKRGLPQRGRHLNATQSRTNFKVCFTLRKSSLLPQQRSGDVASQNLKPALQVPPVFLEFDRSSQVWESVRRAMRSIDFRVCGAFQRMGVQS